MDLVVRVLIIAIVLIAALVALYYLLQGTLLQHVTQQQAEALILSDLQRISPGALINITNSTPSTYAGSWHIVTSVITNATSPCPSYLVYSFDYPQFGFVYRVENTYTKDCVIYGLSTNKTFIVSSFPVAITRAFNLNIPMVNDFINSQGARNVVVTTQFLYNITALGTNYTNVWLVNYSSKNVAYSVYVMLKQVNGTLITAYNRSR